MRSRRVPGRDLELMRQAEEQLTARLNRFLAAVAKSVARQLSEQLGRDAGKMGKAADAASHDRELPPQVRQGPNDIYRAGVAGLHDAGPVVADLHQETFAQLGSYIGDNTKAVLDDRATAALAKMGSPAPLLDPTVSATDGSDWHVRPEDAQPIYGIPVADAVTAANVQHAFTELVEDGKLKFKRVQVPLDSLIATQRVIDRERVLKHMRMLRETGKYYVKNPAWIVFWDDDNFIYSGHHGLQAAYNLRLPVVDVDLIVAPD